MNIADIIESYGMILLGITIIKILYYLILLCKVFESVNEVYKNGKTLTDIHNNQIDEIENQRIMIDLISEQNALLSRIAQALEEDGEPYIIDKEDWNSPPSFFLRHFVPEGNYRRMRRGLFYSCC